MPGVTEAGDGSNGLFLAGARGCGAPEVCGPWAPTGTGFRGTTTLLHTALRPTRRHSCCDTTSCGLERISGVRGLLI